VRSGELAAFVSDSAESRYDVSRQNLLTHQRVLEEILAFTEVIPAQFGLVTSSDALVRESLLEARHDELLETLEHIGGRVELGLKVFWKKETVFEEIVAGRDDIRALRDAAGTHPEGAARLDQIRLGQLVEKAMAALRTSDAEEILELLEPLCVDFKTNTLLTDMMVLNAAFLVEREREARFDAAVNAIAERSGARLLLKYVGPLPPFDFVDLAWNVEA
jgi:hypothetical protein